MVIMTDRKNMSIMELAHQILVDNDKAMSFIELFDIICKEKEISEEVKTEIISQVYADFITSAKFIYVGDDEWDIKGRQTIDLWDKDGAYYDEYPDYEEELSLYDEKDDEYSIDEEFDEEEDEEEDESVYEDDFDEDDIDDEEDSEYDAFVEDDEDYIEDEEDLKFKEDLENDEDYDDFDEEEEEEEEEEQEEFDDEEYNEYMDDYENMYDD